MLRKVLVILISLFIITGCQPGKNQTISPTEPVSVAPIEQTYPQPEMAATAGGTGLDALAYPEPGKTIIQAGVEPVAPNDAPEPLPGKGSISGILYSNTTQQILSLNPFFLTHGLGDNQDIAPPFSIGPDATKGDIVGTTDENGYFEITNVPPGNYYLIAWAAHDWPMAVESAESEVYRLIRIEADKKQPLGVVYLP